jgi:carboxymethylenebutenolidase
MCDDSPLRRPDAGQPRGAKDRLREDELTTFGPGHAGIVRVPEGATADRPAPIIVVAPERYGLVQHTVDIADRFAANGWAAVSPDFYAGISEDEAGRLPSLSDARVMEHIDAALAHLADDPRCDSARVVVFGVCRSGSWGLLASAAHPQVVGVVMLYGGAQPKEWELNADRDRDYAEIIKASPAPVLAIYGERDHTMSIEMVTRVRQAFEDSRRTYRMSIVKDMPHGWLNDTMPGRYYGEVAEAIWTELLTFLREVDPAQPDATIAGPGEITWEFRTTVGTDYDFESNERHE